MRKCSYCDRTEKTHKILNNKEFGYVCNRCYQREKNHPRRYELPQYGEVKYSPDDKPICHICGKAYDKLLSHVTQVHNINARDYKKEFGLDVIKGIMSEESTEIARVRNEENYDLVVEENLLKKGEKTRFEEGCKGRTKDKVSEQTRRKLIKQLIINEKEVQK